VFALCENQEFALLLRGAMRGEVFGFEKIDPVKTKSVGTATRC
jgi:hypothetical protein